MQSYLEIRVPLRMNAGWFAELRDVVDDALPGVLGRGSVKWQNGFHHITIAFLDETPVGVDLRPMLERHLKGFPAPVLTFDKVGVFGKRSGGGVIYLTANNVPESFLTLTKRIREDMEKMGCVIESEFKLHVTLGRVGREARVGLGDLKRMVASVEVPAFTLALTDVDYREFRGRTIYETKLMVK
ncbi:MAG: 2'-5' RNA ligase family protein [Bacteroidales bacterium]|nr:2'-5' RNA ligase family protein [Bacteroidales bacterium]